MNIKQATEALKDDLSKGLECIIELVHSDKTGMVRAYYCGYGTGFAAAGGGYDKYGTVLANTLRLALQGLLRQHMETHTERWQPIGQNNDRRGYRCALNDGAYFRVDGAAGRESVAALLDDLGCHCVCQRSKLGYVYVITLLPLRQP